VIDSKEKVSLSKFGKSFQEDLVHLILRDRPFADQVSEVLDIGFFELKYLQVFVSKVYGYREKYDVHPTCKIMASILRSQMDDENDLTKKQVRDYYARICGTEVEIEGAEYIKETSLEFCKKQKLKEAMVKSVKLLESSSFGDIASLINGALNLGSDNDIGYDYKADFEERFMLKSRDPVSTGWQEIDSLIKGGMGRGELGVVIAPTGAGKSMVLTHLGAHAVMAGKCVVHYTLELADTVIASRYDSCITGVPLKDLTIFKEQIYDKIQLLDGKLIVKEYPTKSASVQTIKVHLEKLNSRGINPDLIIVDYGDILKPINNKREKRMELESIYEDLRGLGQIYCCPVWTASQTNRSGLNAEVITMESISEAFNKCFVADFIFSVSRTIDDKATNGGRLFVAKNRNGPDGIVYPIFMDTAAVKIRVFDHLDDSIENIVKNVAKKQEERVVKNAREKYKEWRSKDKKKELN